MAVTSRVLFHFQIRFILEVVYLQYLSLQGMFLEVDLLCV